MANVGQVSLLDEGHLGPVSTWAPDPMISSHPLCPEVSFLAGFGAWCPHIGLSVPHIAPRHPDAVIHTIGRRGVPKQGLGILIARASLFS